MDNQHARFVLTSFRPDGADATDPDFAEALKLATENRELGEWLAHERAFDAEFAAALGGVDLPDTLREDILACLAAERGDFPQAEDAQDAQWIGAFSSIHPPAELRDQVLAAMDRTTAAGNPAPIAQRSISKFQRLAVPLAAAAGIAVAFLVSRPGASERVVVQQRAPLGIQTVQAGFVRTLESPAFDLEVKSQDQEELAEHLRQRGLPCPSCMPPGLMESEGLGCRELVVDGKRGSMICFDRGVDGLVHVVIFPRGDIAGEFPSLTEPEFSRRGEWATASFADRRYVYLVLSKMDSAKLAALF